MITIENTSYGYKSNPLIFNNISLEIGNGIYGLLGENGVGKTTLMHLICGLLFPKNGKCSIDGRNTAERQSEGLARYFFLPEELQMPTESIASFAARHSVFYPHFNQEEFKLNLEELKINRKQKLSSVSYGQQKKAMLAYAFALHTPYILLDEPTNGLDITSRQALKVSSAAAWTMKARCSSPPIRRTTSRICWTIRHPWQRRNITEPFAGRNQ